MADSQMKTKRKQITTTTHLRMLMKRLLSLMGLALTAVMPATAQDAEPLTSDYAKVHVEVKTLDGKGNIVYKHNGYTDGAETELIEKVRELLK